MKTITSIKIAESLKALTSVGFLTVVVSLNFLFA